MKVLKAPAKINLALHITGQRDDGYHLLDSLVMFTDTTDASDMISISTAGTDGFTVTDRFADGLADVDESDNLVLKARDHVREVAQRSRIDAGPVHISLQKRLPIASGIGGGSSDAAATLIGLHRHWGVQFNTAYSGAQILTDKLGADVPMCMFARPLRATNIGDNVKSLANVPAMHLVLVNCGKAISTPDVFKALEHKENPAIFNLPNTAKEFVDFLVKSTRNDLQPIAIEMCNDIQTQLDLLDEQGAILSRMSGSGATCFGVFKSRKDAMKAAEAIQTAQPDWWAVATRTGRSQVQAR